VALPELPDLKAASRKSLNLVSAPSGTGWGFTPERGWDYDAAWDSFAASVGGGGSLPGGQGSVGGPGGGGPSFTWDIGLGGITVGPGGGGTTGTPGGIRNTVTGAQTAVSSLFGAIPWSRIAAFLLGLLLILGGIYLIPKVQQQVNRTVKGAIAA